MALDPTTPFVWGAGGAQMTPEAVAAQRKIAQAMLERGSDYSPVKSGWQGAARVAEALMGGLRMGQANAADQANMVADKELFGSLLGQTPGAPVAAPIAATGSPAIDAIPAPASRNVAPGRIYGNDEPSPLDPPSGRDRDLAIRTVVGEAADQGPVGMNAVASVIRNRAVNGGYGGNTASGVVLAPNQFEPWNGGPARDRMMALSPTNPRYQQAAAAVDQAYAGNDPTNGAVNFIQPKLQTDLGRAMPKWAQQPGQMIGDHKFIGGAPVDPAATPYQVAGPATAAPQGDATLPANATPAEGYAVPGQPSPAVAQVAQAMPSGMNPAIVQAMTSPYASAGTKAVASALFQSQLKGDTTDELKEYKFDAAQRAAAGQPAIGFSDWKTALKKAGAVNVTTNVDKGEDSFAKAAGTAQAKRYDDLAADGQQAHQLVSDINTLTDLGKNIGTGKGAELKAAIGPYAEALGVKVDGLSDIQAYEGIVNRVAPSLRVKGSGAQSDYELKNFLKSLPALGNTPEGNAISAATMKGLQENKIRAAEIGSMALNGQIARPEAEKQLRNLPDPMTNYREYMKTNRGAPTATGEKSADEGWRDLGGGIRIREKK